VTQPIYCLFAAEHYANRYFKLTLDIFQAAKISAHINNLSRKHTRNHRMLQSSLTRYVADVQAAYCNKASSIPKT